MLSGSEIMQGWISTSRKQLECLLNSCRQPTQLQQVNYLFYFAVPCNGKMLTVCRLDLSHGSKKWKDAIMLVRYCSELTHCSWRRQMYKEICHKLTWDWFESRKIVGNVWSVQSRLKLFAHRITHTCYNWKKKRTYIIRGILKIKASTITVVMKLGPGGVNGVMLQ